MKSDFKKVEIDVNENGHTLKKFDWEIWKWMPMTMKWMAKDETNENGFNGTRKL